MNKGRLQFRHFESVFETREKAYKYLEDIVNSAYGEDNRLDESLMAEPIVVVYKDADEKPQAIVCIGVEGEKGEGTLKPYHIIDSAKLEEEIQAMSGSTGDIEQELRDEIARAIAAEEALQSEIDATQTGAGLEDDGSYVPESTATYVSDATSLKDADTKLDEELARVEKARKDVTGQDTDEYVPNASLTTRPIAYIADAESLNDADVKLDEAIQNLANETLKNVVVDGVSGVVRENIAVVSISADTIPIGPFEEYTGRASTPHPIHDDYSVLEAVKQVDTNFIEFAGTVNGKVQELSGNVQTLSAETIAFSASTVSEIARLDGRINDSNENIDNLSAATMEFSAATVAEITRLDNKIEDETARAEAAENSISADVTTLSSSTIAFSAETVGEITRLDEKIDAETARAEAAEAALQEELDMTQTGAGLNSDGTYKGHDSQSEGMAYITTATSIDNATVLLDKGIQTETGRATLAEQTISGTVNTFSAATEAFSAATVAEIARVDGRIDSSNTSLSELSASTIAFSANTVSEVARLDTKIEDETARATAAENSISADVTTLSSTTESFSAATVAEIARLDAQSERNKVKSTGNTIVVTEATEGTNLEVNIDAKTILSNNGELKTGLKVAPLAPGELESNVREAFRLVDNEGTPVDNTVIKIYKSSSLVSVELISVGGTDYVRITYIDNEGATQTMDLNIQQLIFEAEFKDGLVVNENGEVRVKIDPTSEAFLTVSSEGVKVSGLQNAIDTAVAAETARATAAEDSISGTVNTLSAATEAFSAATVAEVARLDGRIDNSGADVAELSAATITFSGATVAEIARLDSEIDDETARATAAENSISADVTTLSAATEAFSAGTVAKFELMESGWNVPGSIKHTLEDTFVKSVAVGSAEDANKSLMRYYNDGDEHKYYVSSNANDMYYDGLPLSTVIENIEDEITQSSGATDELSAATMAEIARLDERIDDEIERATDAEDSISGAVDTLSAATESEIERIEDKLSDNERVVSEAINQLKAELDRTEAGAGLNGDGTYTPHNTAGDMANYITNATSLDEADVMLDSALKALENSMTGSTADINELSGQVETFSAATENAISNIQSELDATQEGAGLNANGSYHRHNTAGDMANYITNANSLDEADVMLDSALKAESDRATAAEESIRELITESTTDINELSGQVETFSAATESAISNIQSELDRTQAGAGLNEDGTYTPHNTAGDMGNYISTANSLDDADMILDSALKAESDRATAAEESIRELITESTTEVIELSGQVETFSAATESAISNIQSELDTTQAGAGLNEDGTYHKHNTAGDMGNYISNANSLDEADMMLDSALKALENSMTGSTADINELSGQVETFSAATESAISNIQSELDTTQAGAGLNEDGTYHKHNTAGDMGNYISTANSLDEADVMLDSALKAESDRAIAAEESISGIVNTFSAATESIIRDLQEKLTEANSTIETLRTELQTLSGVVETIESQMADNIYSTVKAMLQGTSKQIKVTPDDANEQITIGFADDAIFGQQNNG